MRRSRRKGQFWRVSSILERSHSTTSTSSLSADAFATIRPKGSTTNAVNDDDVNSICDRVASLNGLPCRMLGLVHLALFIRKPANSRRIEKKLSAFQCSQPGSFRKPLIPTHKSADTSVGCVVGLEAEVAGSEIEFLVIERIVRDMHLAVLPNDFAGGVDHYRRVVINAGSTFFEE